MQAGDTIKWEGVNKTCYGILTETENGEWIVRTSDGHTFPLDVLSGSKSIIAEL